MLRERRRWYAVEWSSSVSGSAVFHQYGGEETYRQADTGTPRYDVRSQSWSSRQFAGTFSYVEWLADEPTQW